MAQSQQPPAANTPSDQPANTPSDQPANTPSDQPPANAGVRSRVDPKPREYLAIAPCFLNGKLYVAGERVNWDGPPSKALISAGGKSLAQMELERLRQIRADADKSRRPGDMSQPPPFALPTDEEIRRLELEVAADRNR